MDARVKFGTILSVLACDACRVGTIEVADIFICILCVHSFLNEEMKYYCLIGVTHLFVVAI